MRGVTWQAVPAKFKTGMCEMKKIGSEVCSVFWDLGSGWVGAHAWCNMGSCSGKAQNRDVWDENLRVWGFVVYLWNVGSGLAHMRGVIWRAAPAKFKRGMCEMKILGSEVLWCVFGTMVQGWHTCGVSSVPGKLPTHPEPTSQDTVQTSIGKCSSHTSLFLNFAGTTRNRLHHACVPTHPEPLFQRHTTKPQTPRFSSHTSLFCCSGKVQNRCVRWKS